MQKASTWYLKKMKYKIFEQDTLELALNKLSKLNNKILIVIDRNKNFKGVLTDGDIRRSLTLNTNLKKPIETTYNKKPYYILKGKIINAKNINKDISAIPIIDKNFKFKKFKFKKKKVQKYKISRNSFLNVPVVIMAGGKGKRLKPFTNYIPKPLIPINNKTLLENIINFSVRNGFKKFFITVNYMKSEIIKFIKINNYFKYFKIINEKKPLGTASSLSFFKNKKFDNLIVINCDVLFDIKIKEILKFHFKNRSLITVVGAKKKLQVNYGVLKLNSNSQDIINIDEKPSFESYVNTGFYIVNKQALENIKFNKKYDMNNLITDTIKKGKKVSIFKINSQNWLDFGEWENFGKFEKIFSRKKWVKKY